MVKHKETESESESASHTEEPHFRIAVCMKHFYSDHRARALLYVSARRRVRWLQRRLRRLFALPPELLLLCRGHLLPRDEPLALLDRDDLVEVLPDLAAPRENAALDTVLPAGAAGAIAEQPERLTSPAASAEQPERPPSPAAAAEQPERPPSPAAAVEQPERPPSPGRPDDLLESKRRALLVLDQCYGVEETSQVEPALRVKRRRVRRRRRAPAPVPAPALTDDEHSLSVFREPETTAAVLRNHLLPRAPRLVRDVSHGNVLASDVPRDAVPQDNLTRCDLTLNDISLSPVAHVIPLTKIFT